MAGFVMPIVTGLSILRQQQEEAARARLQDQYGLNPASFHQHSDLGETDEERKRRELGGDESDASRYMRNMMIQMFLRSMLQRNNPGGMGIGGM